MTRLILALTAGGLALVPAVSGAFGRRRASCPPPMPVAYYCPPPVVYVPACPPPVAVYPPAAPAGPTVRQEPAPEPAKPEVKPEAAPKSNAPAAPAPGLPPTMPLKQTGFTEPPTESPPTPKPADPPTIPAVSIPTETPVTPPAQPLAVPPATPPALPTPGTLTLPNTPAKSDGGLTVPTLKPVGPDTSVPPLSIPTPGDPVTRTSQSSPLTGTARVVADVYPVHGPAPSSPAALRTVGFFNQSDRDVRLTVDGQAVTLPRGHQVTARVTATFKWKVDDGLDVRTEVPTAAPGVDVVIRK
jgi:hypothetical protein